MHNLTPTQTVLLDALHLDVDRLSSARLASLTPDQWQALLQLATQQHVVPLLHARLKEKRVETAVPAPIYQHLHHTYLANTLRNRGLLNELHTLTTALHNANIPIIWLKGAYLATAVYPTPGERIIGDLDLLVPRDALPQVIAISQQCGYQPTKPDMLEITLAHRHHIAPFIHPQSRTMLEWHWHITKPNTPLTMPVHELWQRALPLTGMAAAAHTLAPEDVLLHLAYHVSYQHAFSFGIRSLCDLALVSRHNQMQINWDRIVAQTHAWGWQRGVYLALRLAHDLFGAHVPPSVWTAMRIGDGDELVAATAVSQLFIDPNAFRRIPFTLRRLQTTSGTTGRLKIIKSTFFPSKKQMALRYGIAPDGMSWPARLHFRWRDLLQRGLGNGRQHAFNSKMSRLAVNRQNQLLAWMHQPETEALQ